MNPVEAALRALFAAQETLRGELVKYTRGARDIELVALRGQTQSISEDLEGAQLEATTVDWMIDPAELQFDGIPFEPKLKDSITDESGRRYTTALIAGEKCWRPQGTEANTVRIRVHTVHVEASS
jgi:hypothetical protein